jgi:hypothetical protein
MSSDGHRCLSIIDKKTNNMKITTDQLKQIIKEELKKSQPAKQLNLPFLGGKVTVKWSWKQNLLFPGISFLKKYVPGMSKAAIAKREEAVANRRIVFNDLQTAEAFKKDLKDCADYSIGNMGGSDMKITIEESKKAESSDVLATIRRQVRKIMLERMK